ncbi:Glycosyltransferase involved in cell wall bisynthesis [Ruminococcaceae bacterium YRB3002]|nr:Glycosyltransferase involved in cell wall bisynthesis [Ruminococcaceae bacterium YRB3002]
MADRLIDIIVPVFNGAPYIPGFLAQFGSGVSGVGFIFVDDGSEDNSLQLLREAQITSSLPIHIITCAHGGVSAARNAGLAASTAEYVAFFDIDDICSPDYLSSLTGAAGGGGFDAMLFARRMMFDAGGNVFDSDDGAGAPAPVPGVRSDLLREILTDETRFGGIHCLLLRRAFVEERELLFAEGYPYYEDTEYLYRAVALADGGIRVLNRYLYGYVVRHDNSAMAQFSSERIRCLELLENLQPLFDVSVPEFADLYRRYGVARIYWSVLWQAALAAPSCRAFVEFALSTGAADRMRSLKGFPDRKVVLLRALFLISRRLYWLIVNLLGRRYSNVRRMSEDEWKM